MSNLTQEEMSITKKLFLISATNYFHKPEQLKILENAYLKIIGSNMKNDWEKLDSLFRKVSLK